MVRRRTGSTGISWILPLLLFVVFLLGVGYLVLGGEFRVPLTDPPIVLAFSKDEGPKKAVRPAGTVLIPISTKDIRAFTKVTREHLWSGSAARWGTVPMREESLSDQIIVDRKQILGRVLAKDKPAGYIFTEADFLPRGTQPGVVAGIPVGKRGLRVEASQIAGLFGLRVGDRFDLLSTVPVEAGGSGSSGSSGFGGLYGKQMELESRYSGGRQARVRVLAQNAIVVSPVSTRRAPTTSTSLTQGVRTVTKPVQEVVIAVAPEEVAPLMEALAVSAKLNCVPRSGRPGDAMDSVTPDLVPRSPFFGPVSNRDGAEEDSSRFRFVETVRGSFRELIAVPSGSRSDGGEEGRE